MICFIKKKIKSSLYLLNTLLGVTSEWCLSLRLCAKAHTAKVAAVATRWERVGDLIGSRFEPHTFRTRSERLTTYSFNLNHSFYLQKLCFKIILSDFLAMLMITNF